MRIIKTTADFYYHKRSCISKENIIMAIQFWSAHYFVAIFPMLKKIENIPGYTVHM